MRKGGLSRARTGAGGGMRRQQNLIRSGLEPLRGWDVFSRFMGSRFITRMGFRFFVGAGLTSLAGTIAQAEEVSLAEPVRGEAVEVAPRVWQFTHLTTAAEAERWLAREIPDGLMLLEAPDFFAAADEVFFNAEEDLFIYAYYSAETGKWVAWVAFDADRARVVHTAAIDLDR